MLQPALRFGPTRGLARNRSTPPSSVSSDTSAATDNSIAAARQQALNTAALSTPAVSQFTGNLGDTNNDQPTYAALAKALGYQPGEPTPSMGALMAKFQSLSSSVKTGIYKAGGAQFIAPGDAASDIAAQQDALEKVHDTHTNAVVAAIADAKIEPIKGADGKISWIINQEKEIDPNNPLLGKRQVKTPVNPVIQGYIDRAQAKGYIPDPSTGAFPDTGSALLSKQDIQRKMSSQDFQQVLNARANGSIPSDSISIPAPSSELSANLASTLAATKNADLSGTAPLGTSNMQLGAPYQYSSNLNFPEQPGEMQGPPTPTPNMGYVPSGRAAQDADINNEALQNTAASLATKGVNALSRGVNWVGQKADDATNFLFGGNDQSARLPMLNTNFDSTSPNPADIAWFMAHRQPIASDQ